MDLAVSHAMSKHLATWEYLSVCNIRGMYLNLAFSGKDLLGYFVVAMNRGIHFVSYLKLRILPN